MRCHHCDAKAAYAADSDGIRVGLCEDHLQIFVATCADADLPTAIQELAEA